MNVMNRPLFRALGGGAEKFPDLSGDGKVTQKDILIGRGVIEKQEGGGVGAMGPAQIPVEPPLDPLAEDVLSARQQGEKVGLDYLADTMEGIDLAANTEELINSIRGNDAPLEQRVAELATYVGEQDARQTPESVLTMVQPTIMLTEEGALDSGVGALIQQVLGETDMNDEMGQGVGALMAQGQPEPVQQFNQGGAVKKFAPGGEVYSNTLDRSVGQSVPGGIEGMKTAGFGLASVPGLESLIGEDAFRVLQDRAFSQRAPRTAREAGAEFQKLMEEAYDVEGARAASDREAALDLARAGFAFASGRDPRTGENMAGRGFLAQLGTVGQQYAESAAERLARERKGEQAIRLAAVQQGIAAEERDLAEQQQLRSQAVEKILQAGIDERRLAQQGKTTQAQLRAAGNELQATLGYNASESDATRKFQAEQTERKAEISEKMARLEQELQEAQEQNNFGRTKELKEIIQNNTLELAKVNFDYGLAMQMDKFRRERENRTAFINLQGGIDRNLTKLKLASAAQLQDDQQAFLTGEAALDRQLKRDLSEDELNYRRDVLKLSEQEFLLKKGLAPSTSNSFLFDISFGLFGESSQARSLNQIKVEMEQLRKRALEQGIDQTFLSRTDQDLANYINLADLSLRQENLAFQKSNSVLSALAAQGVGPKFGTAAEQTELLGNTQAINAYAQGLNVPGFDIALNNMFGTVTLDNRGNQVPARKLTPALRAALIKRKEAGFAVPSLPGFANGGGVDIGAGQGLLDPVTGYRFPLPTPPQEPEQIPRTYEPMISRDVEDITLATGGQEYISNILGTAGNTVANVLFGDDLGLAGDIKEAKKAVETLGTVATTTLMAAIPGKDNVELQRMLKNLQVPADTLSLQDAEALDYFKLARNTMALGIQNQEDLLENANLTRKEITKVQTDLAQMNSIQAEYDNIIKAYEAKLKPSQQVFDELDKFFN
tara:strand:- start:30388 stop:33237 length:2850 start_codon:yes stop_codon:yes gene_type:complete